MEYWTGKKEKEKVNTAGLIAGGVSISEYTVLSESEVCDSCV